MEAEKLNQLQTILSNGTRMVFLGGAGVSTESGIPDFRSHVGVYLMKFDDQLLSHSYIYSESKQFYQFYREKMICLTAKPNAAHRKLAELERAGKLSAIVTQNIDGLHQAAGSQNVLELHGSVHRNDCLQCGARYDAQWILEHDGIPHCEACGGLIKPDVVLYEESLDIDILERSIAAISQADVLMIGGTSLSVYPAAGLVRYFQGDALVLLNRTPTQMDQQATLCISDPIAAGLEQITV